MYHLIIRIEKDGREITEKEFEIDADYEVAEHGIEVHLSTSAYAEDEAVRKAIEDAQDELNLNPELWLHEVPVNDDDTDPQGDK